MIELLVAITIAAILLVIAAPNYSLLRDKNKHLSEVKKLQDTIGDARTNAITSRKCNNGQISTSWQVVVEPTATNFVYRLECLSEAGTVIEQADITSQETAVEGIYFNKNVSSTIIGNINSIDFEFLSGLSQSSLHYNDGTDDLKQDHVRMLLGHDDSDMQQTICQGRVAGFPTHNKAGSTCID